MIAPTFNTIALNEFFKIFVQESLILTEDLEKIAQSGNKTVCFDDLYRCTINISYGKIIQFIINSIKLSVQSTLHAHERCHKNYQTLYIIFFPGLIMKIPRQHTLFIKYLQSVYKYLEDLLYFVNIFMVLDDYKFYSKCCEHT